ncbi:MAG TPA: glycosyltransferase family 39 protein [Bryobacteraceae bacterium]|nr:glycosyltransferase family 39 protein [Bryobacteraceae bacterium]
MPLLRPTLALFSPDSWFYYALSQTVFGDFYRTSLIRSYQTTSPYSTSFPPLIPVLLALSNRLFGIDPRQAVSLAALSGLAITPILYLLFRRHLTAALACATVASVSLWTYDPFRDEVFGGRTIPLCILCALSAFAILLKPGELSFWTSGVVGLLLGLATLARFDALMLSLAVFAYLAIRPRRKPQILAGAALAYLLVLSPWLTHNYLRHKKPWVSDNSRVATSATFSNAQFFRDPPATVLTDPLAWSARVAKSLVRCAIELAGALANAPLAAATLGFALSLLFFHPSRDTLGDPVLRRVAALCLVALAGLGGQILIGFFDPRYFSFVILWTAIAALVIAIRVAPPQVLNLGMVALLVAGLVFGFQATRRSVGSARAQKPNYVYPELPPNARVLSDWDCYEFGATTRITSMCLPLDWYDLRGEEQTAFIAKFRPTHFMRRTPPKEGLPVELKAPRMGSRETPTIVLEAIPIEAWHSDLHARAAPVRQ